MMKTTKTMLPELQTLLKQLENRERSEVNEQRLVELRSLIGELRSKPDGPEDASRRLAEPSLVPEPFAASYM